MKLTQQVLVLLADGRFHSGTELGTATGRTRAAVCKAIHSLQTQGLEIFTVRGKGYRLAAPLELLDRERILRDMSPAGRGRISGLEIFAEIDSTSAYLLEIAKHSPVSGYACLAERQTAGRGRRGRRWISPPGGNLYLSLLWRFNAGATQTGGLSLAMAIAVIRALRQLGLATVGVKWPNDIVVEQRKLAGILLEVSGEVAGPCAVVVGVGVNVRVPTGAMTEVDQPWIDLASVLSETLSRNHLASVLLEQMVQACVEFEQHGLKAFQHEWQEYDVFRGQEVTLHTADQQIHGIALGIDQTGALRVTLDGTTRRFHSGEVSLRAR